MSYYDSSTGQLNTPAAQKWIDNNQAAIDWLAKAKEEVTAEQVEAGIAAVTEKQQETGGLMSKPEMES